MKKKLTAMMLAAAMLVATLTGVTPVQTKAETTTTTIEPKYMKTMDEYDSVVEISSKHEFSLPNNEDDGIDVIPITISKDSVVRFDVSSFEQNGKGISWGNVYLYTNQLMTDKVWGFGYDVGTEAAPKTKTSYAVLSKGTYYCRISGHRNDYGDDPDYTIKSQLCVTAIATKDAFSVTAKKATGNSYDLVFNSNLGNDEKILVCYCKGDWTYTDSTFKLYTTDSSTAYRVNEAGSYTVTFSIGVDVKYDINKYNTVLVKNVYADKVKPKVSGVKNGATYKKAVTVKFSDAETGVKSATLNGKKIKSGKKVSAKGSYTLIVTDKAGNKKTVKFKIKK
jgi:hypothetical protein